MMPILMLADLTCAPDSFHAFVAYSQPRVCHGSDRVKIKGGQRSYAYQT